MRPRHGHGMSGCVCSWGLCLMLCMQMGLAEWGQAGDKGMPISEPGLKGRKDILYFLDFHDKAVTRDWLDKSLRGWQRKRPTYLAGLRWTGKEGVRGKGALELQNVKDSHQPLGREIWIEPTDVIHVRWYRKWEKGYDWTQHKMPGIYAWARKGESRNAGRRPTGRDKFGCKLFIDWKRNPKFYTYHPDQKGRYGDEWGINTGPKIQVETGRWYCFELMVKANNAPKRDGELKMWIDGELVAHYKDMRFRDTNDLKINEFVYTGMVGGGWTAKRDQKAWDDQIVVATKYIGPLGKQRHRGRKSVKETAPLKPTAKKAASTPERTGDEVRQSPAKAQLQLLLVGLDARRKQKVMDAAQAFDDLSQAGRRTQLAAALGLLRIRVEDALAAHKEVRAMVVFGGVRSEAKLLKFDGNRVDVEFKGALSLIGKGSIDWAQMECEAIADCARSCIPPDDLAGIIALGKAYKSASRRGKQ